jgi:hypothetical protein
MQLGKIIRRRLVYSTIALGTTGLLLYKFNKNDYPSLSHLGIVRFGRAGITVCVAKVNKYTKKV